MSSYPRRTERDLGGGGIQPREHGAVRRSGGRDLQAHRGQCGQGRCETAAQSAGTGGKASGLKRLRRFFKRVRAWAERWFVPAYRTLVVEESLPALLLRRTVYIVREDGFDEQVALLCPCGCGRVLPMNLLPDERPCWHMMQNVDGTVTLHPSVWRKKGCGSHFWLQDGRIRWRQERMSSARRWGRKEGGGRVVRAGRSKRMWEPGRVRAAISGERSPLAREPLVEQRPIGCEADVVASRRRSGAVDSASRSAQDHPDGGDCRGSRDEGDSVA